MELHFQLHKRRWFFLLGAVAITYIMSQCLLLPYGNALRSLLPDRDDLNYDASGLKTLQSTTKSVIIRNPLTVNVSSLSDDLVLDRVVQDSDSSNNGEDNDEDSRGSVTKGDMENDLTFDEDDLEIPVDLVEDRDVDDDYPLENIIERNETLASDDVETQESNSVLELVSEARNDPALNSTDSLLVKDADLAHKEFGHVNSTLDVAAVEFQAGASLSNTTNLKSTRNSTISSATLKSHFTTPKNGSATISSPGKKKMRCEMPPKSVTSIDEMNNILDQHRRSSRAMRPRWSSPRDQEILSARSQIETAPVVVKDQDLYAPLFRNVSKFKRSYELMERTLKVYIYRDGKKPVFHVPILKGLYASEGWFMKLIRENNRFTVKDPRKAHLFYMPFSSRMLEYTIYVRNSHNRTNLRQYLKGYADKIAAKYPYWNRTGGADHFLVACHDWAPYETRHHMEHCIKALCNADVTLGYKIGRDVSLPEAYVRSARNPLRDLGGKPPSQRHILAFYAGNMHGYLRPILVNYWKDKDPDMRILGPMPAGVASKMNYIQHMKSSKYCICPKGYEVNSPRVVEAIFYECVPVIISDNFVPPLFDVLDWGAFSVILAEKDIPKLKEILTSIPQEKYLQLQLGVKKAQRHFLWHPKPIKYDLFYMTLHSIWYNRVYQIKPRWRESVTNKEAKISKSKWQSSA